MFCNIYSFDCAENHVRRRWFGVVVTPLGTSTKLLYPLGWVTVYGRVISG